MTTGRLVMGGAIVLAVGIFLVLHWGGSPPFSPSRGNGSVEIEKNIENAKNIQVTSVPSSAPIKNRPDPATPQATEETSRKLRDELAAAFGVTDHGLLSEAEKAKVVERVNRELIGSLKYLEITDPNTNQENTWRATINVVKYQECLALLSHDEYLTVDATTIPQKHAEGYDPVTLLNAAELNGQRVAIVLPVSVKPGSELDAMGQLANDAAAQRTAMIVMTFNAQPTEVRADRIRDMLDARTQLQEASRRQQRGEITSNELANIMRELNPRLPPNGVTIDPNSNLLRN
jgi:hypothetical protein